MRRTRAALLGAWAAVRRVGRTVRSPVRRTRGRPSGARPLSAGPWMMLAVAAAGAAIGVTIWLLWDTATGAGAPADRARIRVEVVRTGLAAGAGAGAAVALMLSFRRHAHTEYDTAERRVTELYNAAAEQLGSDKAPVRLTALYTLERLADDNVRHQQTIVNIICAYLRMPYDPTRPDTARRQRRATRADFAARSPAPPDPREEHQVRLTAQRILTTHLHPDAQVHWKNIDLDLTGAALTDFSLNACVLRSVDLSGASLAGFSGFVSATFTGSAGFGGATFTGRADFREATFHDTASFYDATFTGRADFGGTTFTYPSGFGGATFHDTASFYDATFHHFVAFQKVTFHATAGFIDATFHNFAGFGGATFHDAADFRKATFHDTASFYDATFTGTADSGEALIHRFASIRVATFHDFAAFDATVTDIGGDHVFPPRWRIEPVRDGSGRLVREVTDAGETEPQRGDEG